MLQTLLQSYQNVSNSQHLLTKYFQLLSCKRFCKVIKMLAIHNSKSSSHIAAVLQTLLQSYQNVSNSQLEESLEKIEACCKRFCKVIKMLAIHNFTPLSINFQQVANAFAKLSKCQQFTTIFQLGICVIVLQTLLQSYQNVSNSQLEKTALCLRLSCKRFCKVIKMLAIHNCCFKASLPFSVANAFAKLSKCQQFTTDVKEIIGMNKLQIFKY